jgi:hypothetical protein
VAKIKYNVRLALDKKITVEFEYVSRTAAVQIKNGVSTFYSSSGSEIGYVRQKFIPTGTAVGKITIVGQSAPIPIQGRGLFVHAVLCGKPHVLAARWDFLSYQFTCPDSQDTGAIIMCQFKPAPGYNPDDTVDQCIVAWNDRVIAATTNAQALLGKDYDCPITKYPLPRSCQFRVTCNGVRSETKSIVGEPAVCVDILQQLPYLLRKVLQALVVKPFCYMWYDKVEGTISVGRESERRIEGFAYIEATFLNPE